jgi:tryptophan-rich sensory protein
MNQNIFSVIGIALVALYAIGSGLWVNTGNNWYRNLNAPSWQPPDWIFGLIWPYNFIVLGVAAALVAQRLSTSLALSYLLIFALSVTAALTWAYQFYRPHNLEAASIALSAVAVLTLPLLVIAFRASVPVAIALLPYQIWVVTAASLSWAYSRLN